MVNNLYIMRISLNVLNHMGLYLYSNTPAAIAEAIANSWDADATEVRIDLDPAAKTITVRDNGVGMDLNDINDKFLYVGYMKRPPNGHYRTPRQRKPMGRKGIGKLSLFSIANEISVYTRKAGMEPESFHMDAEDIKAAIATEDPSIAKVYEPRSIPFNEAVDEHGTVLKITDLKKHRITQATTSGLKKRLARRFSVLGDDFTILVNGDEVTFQDRDYFHKARFIFQFGRDYSKHCANLDTDNETDQSMKYDRPFRFDENGEHDLNEVHSVSGWIAIAHRSNDLDGDNPDDNLNKIAIVVRGKVAQEDILQSFRLGGMITKYIFGEINADFLDEDDKDDIATSSRQSISEDDPRFLALRSFLRSELKHIWMASNSLKEKKGLERALQENPPLREWYENLPRMLKPRAVRIFAEIDKANIDEARKREFYANGVLAFERLKIDAAVELLDVIDESNIESFLEFLADIDAIEAAQYREIVKERLKIIQRLHESVAKDALEQVLQEYIFDHLWLLDPGWERATEYANMEERIQAVVSDGGVDREATLRMDIRYRRVAAAHVVLELKRGSVKLAKTEIENQLTKYMHLVERELKKDPEQGDLPVQGICLVGKLPQGWEDPNRRMRDEESLRVYRIRIMTYQELINNAESGYAKFLKATAAAEELTGLLDRIRGYEPEASAAESAGPDG